MDSVIKLLEKKSVSQVSVRDIQEFIAHYPEWLLQSKDDWDEIIHIRNHIFLGCKLDTVIWKDLLSSFICDLINTSLDNVFVFDEFSITDCGTDLFTKYKGNEISIADYEETRFSFQARLKDSELSGVAFLLNILDVSLN